MSTFRFKSLFGGALAVAALAIAPASASALSVFNAKPISGVEGSSIDGDRIVAFEDDGACNEGGYSINVAWGDGTSSAGTIERADEITPGTCFYDAAGSHTYRTSGAYQVTATVCGPAGCAAPVTATASIAEAELRGAGGVIQTVTGTQFSGTVAEVNDRNRESVGSDFTATIDWGDGTPPTTGQVAGTNGRHEVSGSHTYAQPGVYRIAVTIVNSGRSVLLDPGSANVVAAGGNGDNGNDNGQNPNPPADVNPTANLRVLTSRIRLATLRRSGLRLRIGVGGFRNRTMAVQLIDPRSGRRIGTANVNVATTTLQGRERVATVRVRFSRSVLRRLRRGQRYGLRIANTGGLGRTLQANVTIR